MTKIRLFDQELHSQKHSAKQTYDFHRAAEEKNNTLRIKREIDKLKDVNALIPYALPSIKGCPLLSIMASNGRLDVLEYLVEHKNANLDVQGNSNYTALKTALQDRHYNCALYLIKKGAFLHQSVLDQAVEKREENSLKKTQQLDVVKELLKRGVTLKSIDSLSLLSEYSTKIIDKIRIQVNLEETSLAAEEIGITMSYLGYSA